MKIGMMSRAMSALAVVLCAAATASAHFVWIESTTKDGTTSVRAGFGEGGNWDEPLVDNIKQTKYWARVDGKLEPLALPLDKETSEYRGKVTGKTPSAIIATCDYGIFSRGQKPGHLQYTAKNLIGAPAAWQDSTRNKDLRIELLASLDGDAVKLQALMLGKPLALAKIKATNPDSSDIELKTDAEGIARWPLVGGGVYRCYVGTPTPESGEHNGKKFEVKMDYTSLTFEIAGAKAEAKTAAKAEAASKAK
jgi:uncharacterized GH25 family protein